jgi:serine O-acetyltransferase
MTAQLDQSETSVAGPSRGGAAAGLSFRGLLRLMREDSRRHLGETSRPGLHAVWVQRLGAWRYGLPAPARKPVTLLYRALHVFVRNVYGIEIFDGTALGRRVWIAHQGGVVIDWDAEIGDGCVIHQNVTIAPADDRSGGSPRLGRDVHVAAGAIVIGPVTIGDGARIGPNAVVVADVPAGGTAYAPPARQLPPPKSQARDGDAAA